MSIINILAKMVILFVWAIVQTFGVIIEGVYKFFGKLVEYLMKLNDKLVNLLEGKLMRKANVNVPL